MSDRHSQFTPYPLGPIAFFLLTRTQAIFVLVFFVLVAGAAVLTQHVFGPYHFGWVTSLAEDNAASITLLATMDPANGASHSMLMPELEVNGPAPSNLDVVMQRVEMKDFGDARLPMTTELAVLPVGETLQEAQGFVEQVLQALDEDPRGLPLLLLVLGGLLLWKAQFWLKVAAVLVAGAIAGFGVFLTIASGMVYDFVPLPVGTAQFCAKVALLIAMGAAARVFFGSDPGGPNLLPSVMGVILLIPTLGALNLVAEPGPLGLLLCAGMVLVFPVLLPVAAATSLFGLAMSLGQVEMTALFALLSVLTVTTRPLWGLPQMVAYGRLRTNPSGRFSLLDLIVQREER